MSCLGNLISTLQLCNVMGTLRNNGFIVCKTSGFFNLLLP